MIAMQRSKDNIWTKVHHNSSVMGTQKILAEVALTYICKRICHWKTRQTHLKAKKVQPHRGSTYIFLQMDLKRKTMSDRIHEANCVRNKETNKVQFEVALTPCKQQWNACQNIKRKHSATCGSTSYRTVKFPIVRNVLCFGLATKKITTSRSISRVSLKQTKMENAC